MKRFTFWLLLAGLGALCFPRLGFAIANPDPFESCLYQVGIQAQKLNVILVAEKYSEYSRKVQLLNGAVGGSLFLGMEAAAFDSHKAVNFPVRDGVLNIPFDPAGPIFGIEEADLVDIQEMALLVKQWDRYYAEGNTSAWDDLSLALLLKFVVQVQHQPTRWEQVQARENFVSANAINYLRQFKTLDEMRGAFFQGHFPNFVDFGRIGANWGAVATEALMNRYPETRTSGAELQVYFSEEKRRAAPFSPQQTILSLRYYFMARNLAKFIISSLGNPKPIYLVTGPAHTDALEKMLREKFPSDNIKIEVQR